MTDTILFVKEAKTCSYVVVIHTPRLCGEPGFKSRRDTGEEAQIRCREIVDTLPEIPTNLPASDHPIKPPRRKPIPPPPVKQKAANDKAYNDMLRKALEALMGTKDVQQPMKMTTEEGDEVVIEVLGEDFMTQGQADAVDKLTEALRAAGYDIKSEKANTGNKGNKKEPPKKQPAKKYPRRD
jgi:protein OS-9